MQMVSKLVDPDQLVGQLCCTGQRAGTAQGIQHKNLLFGCFSTISRAASAALQPPLRLWLMVSAMLLSAIKNSSAHSSGLAGGGAGTVIIRHGLQHGFGVQGGQVHKLALANANLE